MQKDPEIQKKIIPYLLGELSPEEQKELEDQYFNDDRLFEEMGAVEDELIEAQVYGELSGSTLERFKDQFSKPVRREQVDFTKALLRYAQAQSNLESTATSRTPQVKHSRFQSIFQKPVLSPRWLVFVSSLLVILGSVSLIYFIWARREINQLRNERAALEQRARELENNSAEQNARIEQLASELNRTREGLNHSPSPTISPEPRTGTVGTGVIIARLVRGGKPGIQVVEVPSVATVLRLQVIVEKGDYESYRILIEDGGEVFRQDQLKGQEMSNRFFVPVEIPLRQLASRRRYLLTVSGIDSASKAEVVGQTYFRFVRR